MFAKPKFRSRKLENGRALPVYRWDAYAAIEEDALAAAAAAAAAAGDAGVRGIAPVATGVEKEEEDETHLVQALNTQLTGAAREAYSIPTPDAAALVPDYDVLYPAVGDRAIDAAIAAQDASRDASALLLVSSTDSTAKKSCPPVYCADEHDKAVSERLKVPVCDVERIVDALEEAAARLSVPAAPAEACARLGSVLGPAVVGAVSQYWAQRRAERDTPLVPRLRHDDTGRLGSDPYVCFRRRELRVARKTRRSDGQVLERLARLRRDLSTASLLLRACSKRDVARAAAIDAEAALFARYVLADTALRSAADGPVPWPASVPPFRSAATAIADVAPIAPREVSRPDAAQRQSPEAPAHPALAEASALAAARAAFLSAPYLPGTALYTPDLSSAIAEECLSLSRLFLVPSDVRPAACASHIARMPSLADGRLCVGVRKRSRLLCAVIGTVSDDSFSGDDLSMDAVLTSTGVCSRPAHDVLVQPHAFAARTHARLLSARDYTALHTPLGSLNAHAVQTANTIQRHMSHQAWVASTAPILASMTASGSGVTGATLFGPAPRKRKPSRPRPPSSARPSAAPSGETVHPPPGKSALPGEQGSSSDPSSRLPAAGQITVKVKTKPDAHDTRPA